MSFEMRDMTALVTGASAGIGAEFARHLAGRGAHLVLVARRKDRLEQLADEIRDVHGVRVHVLPFDLARADAGRELRAQISTDVQIVVNNAGFGSYGDFVAGDPELMERQILVNVAAVTDISRAFLPGMVALGAGALINIASMAAYAPTPSMPVYGATKAYVLSLTEALAYQTRKSPVRVLAFSPGATESEFYDVVGTREAGGGRWQTPAQVVINALRALDRPSVPSAVSGRTNALGAAAMRLFPRHTLLNVYGRLTYH